MTAARRYGWFFLFLAAAAGGLALCLYAQMTAFQLAEQTALAARHLWPGFWGIRLCMAAWVVYLAVWCVSLAMVRGGETGRPGRAAALCGALALVPAALTIPVALQAAGLL